MKFMPHAALVCFCCIAKLPESAASPVRGDSQEEEQRSKLEKVQSSSDAEYQAVVAPLRVLPSLHTLHPWNRFFIPALPALDWASRLPIALVRLKLRIPPLDFLPPNWEAMSLQQDIEKIFPPILSDERRPYQWPIPVLDPLGGSALVEKIETPPHRMFLTRSVLGQTILPLASLRLSVPSQPVSGGWGARALDGPALADAMGHASPAVTSPPKLDGPPRLPNSQPSSVFPLATDRTTTRKPGILPRYHAVLAPSPPRIDGRLDDDVWRLAKSDSDFIQKFPDEGRDPTEKTQLSILYDANALYIGIRCWDRRPQDIVSRLTRRDRETESDHVSVEVSSKKDKSSAYHFDVNVAGVQVDGVRSNDVDYNPDWDGLWVGRASRDDQGWSAEFRIPLGTLRYEGHVTDFGLQVRRYLQRRQEIDEWSYIPSTTQGEVSNYGILADLNGLKARRLFQLQPYLAGKLALRTRQEPLNGVAPGGNLGLDVKLGVTSALTLDATINPDFGQVEADQVVLNLTTIEVFYPEKRPFFLEGIDLFDTPFQQFYSRRIGLTPEAPYLTGRSVQLEPLPDGRILGAAKLTGLIGDRLSINALDAITARGDIAVARSPDAPPERRLIMPMTNFGVLRLRQDFSRNSYVGLLLTTVNRFESPGEAAPNPKTDYCPDGSTPSEKTGRCFRDAYTAGVDVRLRTTDGTWSAMASVVGSAVANGATLQIPDGTLIKDNTNGMGMRVEVGKYGGLHWLGNISYSAATPTLFLNDAGYIDQANYHSLEGTLTWRTTRPMASIQDMSLSLHALYIRSWDLGDTLQAYGGLLGSLRFKNFWKISFQYEPFLPFTDNREARDGARTERVGGISSYYITLKGRTDPRRLAIFELRTTIFSVRDGLSLISKGTLSLRPAVALELDLIGGGTWTFGDPRWFNTVFNSDASRTYYFGNLDSRSIDVTLRGTYTFTSKLSLQVYAQLFLASGHYGAVNTVRATGDRPVLTLDSFVAARPPEDGVPDFREGAVNLNVLFRWEYQPGSTLIVAFTHSQQQLPFNFAEEGLGQLNLVKFNQGPITDVLLVKLNYLWEPLATRLVRRPDKAVGPH